METDRTFAQIFRQRPDWLSRLAGVPLPFSATAGPGVFKPKVECDLVVVPDDPSTPCHVWEFQFYHDHSALPRTDLARLLVWRECNPAPDCRRRDFVPRTVEAFIVFGDRSHCPAGDHAFPHIPRIFLAERLAELETECPAFPLAALLRPFLAEQDGEVATSAATDFACLQSHPDLGEEDRHCFTSLFVQLLMQRFKDKNPAAIQAMIQELVPVEETRAGRELIEKGLERGLAKGLEKGLGQGLEKGLAEARQRDILDALELRFGSVPPEVRNAVLLTGDQDQLRPLFRAAVTAPSLEEFRFVL